MYHHAVYIAGLMGHAALDRFRDRWMTEIGHFAAWHWIIGLNHFDLLETQPTDSETQHETSWAKMYQTLPNQTHFRPWGPNCTVTTRIDGNVDYLGLLETRSNKIMQNGTSLASKVCVVETIWSPLQILQIHVTQNGSVLDFLRPGKIRHILSLSHRHVIVFNDHVFS